MIQSHPQTSTLIPIDHQTTFNEIETDPSDQMRPLTLMELVDAVSEASETEQEVLATVTYMLKPGHVHLAKENRAHSLFG
jgi:hypothetical protein